MSNVLTCGALAENFVAGVSVGVNRWADIRSYEAHVYGEATGFVYFFGIGRPYTTHVKVGFTRKDPRARMASLQTGCPFKIHMLGFVIGNEDMERELHDVFQDYRCEGEWFELSDMVANNICHLLTAEAL